MTQSPTDKLIQDGLWQDISEAPRDGTVYLGVIIHPTGICGQPFEAHFDDDIRKHVCVFQTEPVRHVPSHFRPFPDDRLANALKVAVSPPDDVMCDAARGFILGLDMNIRTFEGMRKHIEGLGEPIPEWMPPDGHITKWDIAQCIYNLMQDVRLAEINRIAENKGE